MFPWYVQTARPLQTCWHIHLPLVIDYRIENHDIITAADEKGAILALKQHDRIRRVCPEIPAPNLQKFIPAIDEEYSILEYLAILDWAEDNSSVKHFRHHIYATR